VLLGLERVTEGVDPEIIEPHGPGAVDVDGPDRNVISLVAIQQGVCHGDVVGVVVPYPAFQCPGGGQWRIGMPLGIEKQSPEGVGSIKVKDQQQGRESDRGDLAGFSPF